MTSAYFRKPLTSFQQSSCLLLWQDKKTNQLRSPQLCFLFPTCDDPYYVKVETKGLTEPSLKNYSFSLLHQRIFMS